MNLIHESVSPKVSDTENKKAYVTPRLREFGSVRALTQNGAGSGTDGGTTSGMTMVSDRLAKENIQLIGTHPLGFGLYLFDYKDQFARPGVSKRQFGVMADEVALIVPQAVTKRSDGYKQVNYALLGVLPSVNPIH